MIKKQTSNHFIHENMELGRQRSDTVSVLFLNRTTHSFYSVSVSMVRGELVGKVPKSLKYPRFWPLYRSYSIGLAKAARYYRVP